MADQVIDSLLGSACVVPHGYRLGWPPDCEGFQGLVTAATAGVTAIQLWPRFERLEPPSPSALQEANAKSQRVLEEKDGALREIHRLFDSDGHHQPGRRKPARQPADEAAFPIFIQRAGGSIRRTAAPGPASFAFRISVADLKHRKRA